MLYARQFVCVYIYIILYVSIQYHPYLRLLKLNNKKQHEKKQKQNISIYIENLKRVICTKIFHF